MKEAKTHLAGGDGASDDLRADTITGENCIKRKTRPPSALQRILRQNAASISNVMENIGSGYGEARILDCITRAILLRRDMTRD